MLMEKSIVGNGFIIDLSSSQNTTQLVSELNSLIEHPDVKGKEVCLKLGSIDLKQSQLLSIKALIESKNASIAFVDSLSGQTVASAESLGIKVSKVSNQDIQNSVKAVDSETINSISEGSEVSDSESKKFEVSANLNLSSGPIETAEGIEDIYDEVSTQEISEIIQADTFDNHDFSSLATHEGLIHPEDANKYILLDTGNVLPEGIEESSSDNAILPTLYLNQTLRSGQTVNYDGNILIIGDAHPGSEIVASGDITVWGILGGIAHAGSSGNVSSKVRALKLNAIQLRIAGLYARRNDTLNVPYVQKSDEFTPEEALIEDGRIVIYKKLRRN